MSSISEDEYRRLLLKHGVALELPSADIARRLLSALTGKDGKNPVAAENAEVRNSAAFGHFVSGSSHVLVLPPVKNVLLLVAGALTHEARTGKPKAYAEAARELLWAIPDVARSRGLIDGDMPFGGLMRVMAGSGHDRRLVLVAPGRLKDDGDIIKASSTDFLTTGTVRTFKHDGELFTPTSFSHSGKETCAGGERLVPRAQWKGKTYTAKQLLAMWDKKQRERGDSVGLILKVMGKPHVVAENCEFAPAHPALRFK